MGLENDVIGFLKLNSLLNDLYHIVIGVSGGPDSVAMVNVLHGLNQRLFPGCKLYIAHLNHKLRGTESDKDADYVKCLALQLNIPVIINEVDITSVSKESKRSIEESARTERYKFLENCALKVGAQYVAVAHTADDNVETLLHRIIRGTGVLGLCGIKAARPISTGSGITLIRPLLSIWKEDIINYLEMKKLSFRVDSSNLERVYLRNKIRLDLIPTLEKSYNRKVKHALANLCEISNSNYRLIEGLSHSLSKASILESGKNRTVFDVYIFSASSAIIQHSVLQNVFTEMGIPLKQIGYKKYISIINYIKDNGDDKVLNLRSGLSVYKKMGKATIQWVPENELMPSDSGLNDEETGGKLEKIVLSVPGMTVLTGTTYKIEATIIAYEKFSLKDFMATKTENEEVVDLSKINFPLYVRARETGDRFFPLGAIGTKKLKNFFIDNKVPVGKRDNIPIVMSKDFPVWIVGFRIDNRVRISENTRNVLILKYCRSALS